MLLLGLALLAACPPGPRLDLELRTSTNAAAISALEAYAFTLTGEDADRKGIRTDGLLILSRGKLVYERYGRGFDANKRHLAWSVSKSVSNVLAGRAVNEGKVSTTDSVCKYLPGREGPSCEITLEALLQHASGLDWNETYENQSNQESSVLAMLYGQGAADMGGFVFDHPRRAAPLSRFSYSTGDSTLLTRALHEALKGELGDDWPWPLLFDRIGITSAVFERDATGAPIGGSYFYATPRDYLRIGALFMNDGCWDGARLLPEGWVRDSVSTSTAFASTPEAEVPVGDVQGRQWWLNLPEKGREPAWKRAPLDTYAAQGHWGQYIVVIPSRELIIVRTGDDREDDVFDLDELIFHAMAVAR